MSYVPGLTKEVKKAINSGTKKVEHLMEFGSSMSLTKVLQFIVGFTDRVIEDTVKSLPDPYRCRSSQDLQIFHIILIL